LACSLIPTPLPHGPLSREAFPRLVGVRAREDNGFATFRRCTRVGKVASLRRWPDICALGVRGPRTWPRAILAQAIQQLALVLCNDACDASPGLTNPTRSWFPTALLLAVAVTAHALAALPREEATFCRELDTPSSPKTHLPVGYRWQNSGCCQSVPRAAAQLHRRPRVAPERHSSATGRSGSPCSLKDRAADGWLQRPVQVGPVADATPPCASRQRKTGRPRLDDWRGKAK
jgi:hypothetical protein